MVRRRHVVAATAVTALGFVAAHHSAPQRPTLHSAIVKPKKHATAASREARFLAAPRPTPASRSHVRKPLPEPTHAESPTAASIPEPGAFLSWLHSSVSHQVRECESSFDYGMVDVNYGVTYFGAWSANADFVRTYAHVDPWDYVISGRFTLSKTAQDRMAYRGWQSRGWQPWACAS